MQFLSKRMLLTSILVCFSFYTFSFTPSQNTQNCISCHTEEASDWSVSDHSKAMSLATADKVLGNFKNQSVTHYSQRVTFFIENEIYKAQVFDSNQDEGETFEIKYTFGHYPLQQYLVETAKGRLQVLPFAWDSRTTDEGGQRWYHNYSEEEVSAKDRLHWRQPLQNWNGMCADCHSDQLKRNYAPHKNIFDTRFLNINVGCVSCHGVMNNHTTADTVGSTSLVYQTNQWLLDKDSDTAIWRGETRDNRFMDTCFACHSLRSPLSDGINSENAFLDQFTPSFVSPPNYYPDGQIKEEVYVYGSFLQSKMYAEGVNCLDCHDKHTMKLKVEGNGLCLQCHKASVFETKTHHQHKLNTQGSQCVNCHMPDNIYMGVDSRRDHSFKIPRPDLSAQYDTPNACLDCHQEQSNQWASDELQTWFGEARALSQTETSLLKLRHGQRLSLVQILDIAHDQKIDTISRASALTLLNRAPDTAKNLRAAQLTSFVGHKEPLIRIAVARAAQQIQANDRIQLLLPLLSDPLKSVRVSAANALVGLQVAKQDIKVYRTAFNELLIANDNSAWRGEGRVNQANINLAEQDVLNAELNYQASIDIDPFFAVAYINLADVYRAKQREELVADVLQQGLKSLPKSADLAYAYGLHLVRIKQTNNAIKYFENAMNLNPQNSQLAYTFVLALDGVGKSEQALSKLKKLMPKYNNHPQLVDMGLYLSNKLQRLDDFNWFKKFK